ncbi:MAG: hypothetical protein ACI8QZ_003405 [Chlamydiales bacterium]|jgi:hypothetical protein
MRKRVTGTAPRGNTESGLLSPFPSVQPDQMEHLPPDDLQLHVSDGSFPDSVCFSETMTTIRMTGWRRGLRKVSLTQTLMETGLGLKNAKSCTDRLLEGDVIEVQVELDQSEDVLRSLHQLGVDVELTEDPPDKPTQTDGPSDRR